MTYIKPQRPAAPWSNHNFWGQYDEAANLPNTATSDIQVSSSELQRGDIAWAELEGSLYYCDTPTAGAAVWLPLGSGGGGTTLASDYYLSADNGNDANDGLTPATAVATLGRIIDILNEAAFVEQGTPVVVHVGRNTATGFYEWDRTIEVQLLDDLFFYADGAGQPGEDGFVELVPSTAAVAGSDIQQLQLAAGPIPADNDFFGRTIEILSGAAAGDRRTIRNHTTTQVWPVRPFSDAIAPGDTFRIVEPETAFRPFEDVNKPGQVAQLHKKTSQSSLTPTGTQELNDTEFTGTLTFANLRIQNNPTAFFPMMYKGTLRLFGCQRDTSTAGQVSLVATKILAGCDVQNGLFQYFGAFSEPFRLFTGAAVSAFRAGVATGIASWSGWGWTAARHLTTDLIGYLVVNGTRAPSADRMQILGGSCFNWLDLSTNNYTVFGTRFGQSTSSDTEIPFLFNAFNDPIDYGLWVQSGNVQMGSVEFTPLTRFGVVVGDESFNISGAPQPTLKWASNKWQILACGVAFMYVTNNGRLVIEEDIAGAGSIDFSGITGPHLVMGKYEDGPVFEITVPDVRDLQEFDSLRTVDGSTAVVLSSQTVPP